MADREKILRFFRSGGDEELAAKLLDLAENVQKSRKFKVSDFLDPHGLSVAEIVAANVGTIKVEVNGGFMNAERVKAAFVSEDFFGKPDFAIECFQVEWDKRYYTLAHRDILGAFLFKGDDVNKRVSVLSGGEKSRLAMAKLILNPYNLLALDEPTNHMDIRSKDILKQSLSKYNGTLVVVSHDRDFLDGLVTKVLEFKGGRIREHIGTVSDYLDSLKKEQSNIDKPVPITNNPKRNNSKVRELAAGINSNAPTAITSKPSIIPFLNPVFCNTQLDGNAITK